MHGTREVLELYPNAIHIERQVAALEKAVPENPGLAFDLAESLIGSTCITILKDRDDSPDNTQDLPRLLKETLIKLQLVPDIHTENNELCNGLRKTVGGLQTVIQGICEIRNREGFASHGKDGYTQPLDEVQAQLIARAADAIINFLVKAHKSYNSQNPNRRLYYADYPDFNEFIDNYNPPIDIFNSTYDASEVLFELDPLAYREILGEYLNKKSAENEISHTNEE